MERAIVNRKCLLEKYPGKGGWTYAQIPGIPRDPHAAFGWVKVHGSIDDYEIKDYHLMPMKNGNLFLPVKAAIRKKIGKSAGQFVRVILYLHESPSHLPEELRL